MSRRSDDSAGSTRDFNDPPDNSSRAADQPQSPESRESNSDRDPMAPPEVPCECWCLHCRRVFMSDQIWFQRVINDPKGFDGFWMCPTPNCDGAGYCFDIFPTDPDHPDNSGWCDDDCYDEEEFNEEEATAEWDPNESKYKALDEAYGDEEDDDIDGEEWKYGLSPGERPPEPEWLNNAQREWEEEQKKYDEPDERPRVLDWSDREYPPDSITEDDIPF